MYTMDEINDRTGFANGSKFKSFQQVNDYFTVQNMMDMFGETDLSQDTLDCFALLVKQNLWHCDFYHSTESQIQIASKYEHSIPVILGSTYLWSRLGNSGQRGRAVEKHTNLVTNWLVGLGFRISIKLHNKVEAELESKLGVVRVYFHLSMSAKHVYKTFRVSLDGVKKDIRLLKKLMEQ